MRRQRRDGLQTRQRLLDVACEVFAAKGFWEAAITDICRKANANTAAVNYYFGDKGTLYVEAWRYAFEKSLEAYPPDGGVSPAAPPEQRLHGRILSIMRRVIDPSSYSFDIIHKEMANPTGLLAKVMRESMEPIRKGFASIVRELLGEKATEQQVRLCHMSIFSQCFGPMLHERHRKKSPKSSPACSELLLEDVQMLADHITRFSLSGIREVRRQIVRSGR